MSKLNIIFTAALICAGVLLGLYGDGIVNSINKTFGSGIARGDIGVIYLIIGIWNITYFSKKKKQQQKQ